jgi:hypothetical protein
VQIFHTHFPLPVVSALLVHNQTFWGESGRHYVAPHFPLTFIFYAENLTFRKMQLSKDGI